MPTKIRPRWITGATLLAMAASLVLLLIGCLSVPADHARVGIGAPTDDDSLDVNKISTTTGAQKIAITVHPPGEQAATRGSLDKHRVFITFEPEDPRDTVSVDVVPGQPGDKQKKLAVVLSTPSPVTHTTGPHPIVVNIEPGKKH